MTHKRRSAKEMVDIMVEFLSTNMGVAEMCRKYAISPTTFDNWRRRFMDAGKRDLSGIGGDGRSDPAKALAKESESPKIVVGELTLVNSELKKPGEERVKSARACQAKKRDRKTRWIMGSALERVSQWECNLASGVVAPSPRRIRRKSRRAILIS